MTFSKQLHAIAQESYNKRSERSMLISALIISLLAGVVIRSNMFGVYENAKIGFFIIVCCAMWMGLFDSILCICDKRDVLERDKFSGLKPATYILAVIVFQAFHACLQSLVMFIITRVLVSWPTGTVALIGPAAFAYFVTLFLITFAAQMLGLAVSSLMKTSEKALTVAPFLLIYELIMSETIFGLPAWLEPLKNTTIVQWGLDGLGTIYDIDALPWRAEGKIQEIVSSATSNVDSFAENLGIDPNTVNGFITNILAIDPSMMGVNHDLAEYTATSGHLGLMWLWLLVLAIVGAAVAMAGFMHKMKER